MPNHRGNGNRILDGRARGVHADKYSSRAPILGSGDIIMAVVQKEEIALSQSRSQSSRSQRSRSVADKSPSCSEGKLMNVEGEVCGAILAEE